MMTFHEQLEERGEAFIDEIEANLSALRELAETDFDDSIHDADYEGALEAARRIAATIRLELLLLDHMPSF